MTFIDVESLAHADTAEVAMQMDEDAFRAFYDSTARPVWLYLSRLTHNSQLADDLLQETYYRFLRTERTYDSDAHRRNYLFRIATNLARDDHRRQRVALVEMPDEGHHEAPRVNADGEQAAELSQALGRLKPRERALLWLAYAQGSSHVEIAESLGLKSSSVKALLLRARRRLAKVMKGEAR